MNLDAILGRIDLHDIHQYFFSKEAIEMLTLLKGGEFAIPSNLKDLISRQFPPEEMLRYQKIRSLLIDVLHKDEANDLTQRLGLDTEGGRNAYNMLRKTRFHKNSNDERILFDFFEEAVPEIEGGDNTVDVDVAKVNMELFDYQRKAVDRVKEHLSSDRRRCLLHMPTGSGKTKTAMRVIASLLVNSNHLIMWLAYREELCEQAIEEFKKAWYNIGDRSLPIFRFFGNHSTDILGLTKLGTEGFIVASLGKIREADKRQDVFLTTLADRLSMVIMDEAHQAVAPTYRMVLEQLIDKRPGTVGLLGLSATPGRVAYDAHTNMSELPDFFDHNKVPLDVGDEIDPIQYLIKKGYLASPTIRLIRADGGLTDSDLKSIKRNFTDIPKKVLEKLGQNTRRTLKTIGQVEELIHSGHRRIIVFGPTIRSSRNISLILSAIGHKSFHIDNETSDSVKKKLIELYKNDTGDAMIMCNVGMFTTGFDAPITSAVVIARPTKSLVLYSQMAGRAMRGPKMGGNEKCEIRTITDIRIPVFTTISNGFFGWEDIW